MEARPGPSGRREDAAVVICAYTLDRWDDLRAAVASVQAQSPPPQQIIVVIDHNEALRQRAEREIEGVVVVANRHTPGVAGGRITGARLVTAPFIVFLDDDAIAEPGWLDALLKENENFQILGVGGHIEPLWREPPPSWFPFEFNWVVGCTYAGMPIYDGQVRNVISSNMSVRTEVFRRVGNFATKLGHRAAGGAVIGVVAESCEDTEFCIRASRLHPGGVWMHCPAARVRHVVPPQRTTWRYFVRRCGMEGTAKAVMTGLTGTRDGLRSERRYTFFLVGAVWRYLLKGEFRRAAAVCAGFSITVAAYARARLARAMVRQNLAETMPVS